ncbi:uncharacterized protein C8Q71DRAFT_791587 [Rhodofomes roseus]|uniref:Cytochrome b561 domain-containing protein n=1 Tax=Rhodofomes roseus TaxID=34475 RepID=A0ABQ8JY64_9APHY|nr:uncharacterized protein C8Q71DRAFT_791587 [Rhodofomes roseus]KAH9829196.1 hypothetical protein C8Q71DRAFT_791587 [Rhodofomes roseus]
MSGAIALMPTPKTEHFTHDEHGPGDEEDAPLIVEDVVEDTMDVVLDPDIVRTEGRSRDHVAQIAAYVAAGVFLMGTWVISFVGNPVKLGWFFWHPILQSLSICLLAYGIVTLQPTSQPKTKAAGLARHQYAMLCGGYPALLLGTLAIWWNKTSHGSHHATTWHGILGYISVFWMVVQVFIGIGSVWFDGRLFGGNSSAKLVWKYHRLSGYLLFPLLLFTAFLAGIWSHFTTRNTVLALRVILFGVAPLVLLLAVCARVRLSKMRFF